MAKHTAENDATRRTVRPINGYACHHCGKVPDPNGDHSCPCPYTDEACPNHPVASGPNTHARGQCSCGHWHDYGEFL